MTDEHAQTDAPTYEDAVWRLATSLAGATTVDEVATALAEQGGRAAGASFASMAVLDEPTGLVRVAYHQSAEGGAPHWRSFHMSDQVPACEAMRTGLPVLLGSLDEVRARFPAVLADVVAAGLRARASLPVHSSNERMLGAIGFGWPDEQRFPASQLRRLDLVAQLVALAFERAVGPDGTNLSAIGWRAIESMPTAFVALDRQWRVTALNPEAERLFATTRASAIGRRLHDIAPAAAGDAFEPHYRRALQTGHPVLFEEYAPALGGWFEIRAWPEGDNLNVSCTNIDERRRLQAERLTALTETRKSNDRLTFLTGLSSRLAGSTTRAEVLERFSQAVIPTMADWSTLVVPEGEELVRVAAAHRDPDLDGLAKRLVGSYPHAFSGPSPGVVVYRSGEHLALRQLARQIVADLDDSTASAAYGRTLLLLGDGPGLIWPVVHRNEVIAVLTSVRSSGDPFTDDDVAVMAEATLRVSAYLDEVGHIEAQREAAAALQAAALPTALPTTATLNLAAGYRPATGGSQVGGDWYDALSLPNGRTALVVGDAAGHGLQAAAVMTQMRNILRANLFSAMDPAAALARLDDLVTAQEPGVFGTVVCVEVDPASGEVVWASAGHPPPVLVSGDGASVHLRGSVAPPIGCADLSGHTAAALHHLTLSASDRLVLFTDGLVERRHSNLDIGITHLMILAEQSHTSSAEEACQSILDGMLTDGHEDDVCLFIADFHPPSP